MMLGTNGSMTAALARKTAEDLFHKVRLGKDPATEKDVARAETQNTVGDCIEKFLRTRRTEWRARSYNEIARHLQGYCKSLHRLPVTAVKLVNIAALLDTIDEERGPVAANRVRTNLSSFFSWLLSQGVDLPAGNPVAHSRVRPEQKRDRVLSDNEIRQIWNAAGESNYGSILRLLMLTGQRESEIGGLRYDEIADDQIHLPGERTKNKRAHIVPLSEPARAILAKHPQRESREFVFGITRGYSDWGNAKSGFDARVPMEHWTLHDLRRTAATRMADLGVAPHVVEAVLNHVSGHKAGVAGIYNRATYANEKRAALELWGEHVLSLVEERKPVVVPMKRA